MNAGALRRHPQVIGPLEETCLPLRTDADMTSQPLVAGGAMMSVAAPKLKTPTHQGRRGAPPPPSSPPTHRISLPSQRYTYAQSKWSIYSKVSKIYGSDCREVTLNNMVMCVLTFLCRTNWFILKFKYNHLSLLQGEESREGAWNRQRLSGTGSGRL
jgi:hypothetical protein